MRLPEFITTIFSKYAPVSPETLGSLKIELTNMYMKNLATIEEKKKVNADLLEKQAKIEKELDGLDEHSPEFENKLFEFGKISQEIEKSGKTSILEKAVSFFEQPLVRLCLLVACVFVSRWIAKKLTQSDEPEKEEQDEQAQPYNYPPNGYPPYGNGYPSYAPYGYGYMPPQPPQGTNRR